MGVMNSSKLMGFGSCAQSHWPERNEGTPQGGHFAIRISAEGTFLLTTSASQILLLAAGRVEELHHGCLGWLRS